MTYMEEYGLEERARKEWMIYTVNPFGVWDSIIHLIDYRGLRTPKRLHLFYHDLLLRASDIDLITILGKRVLPK